MNPHKFIISLFLTMASVCTAAQTAGNAEKGQLTQEEADKLKSLSDYKEGISIIPLPIISYTTDLGLQLGAYAEIYNYGKNPSVYPKYKHKWHVEGSYFTKGEVLVHAEYDSKYLIPGIRTSFSASYENAPLYRFYGFNGSLIRYDSSYDRKNGYAYYSYNRESAQVSGNFIGNITSHLHWAGGLSFLYYRTGNINSRFGYDTDNTLYKRLTDYGIINFNEGGVLELKGGISYDTRDFEASPRKGIWGEVYLTGSPNIFATGFNYLSVCAHFRHYITPGPDWLTLAYHFGLQQLIAGEAPFFILPNIQSLEFRSQIMEGLGGGTTIRGILGSRLVGNGYAWANFEARFRIVSFMIARQRIDFGVNPFVDCGLITTPYKLEEMHRMPEYSSMTLNDMRRETCFLHGSAGAGLKFGMNRNYILSFEFAKAFRDDDGPFSIGCSLNYIF